MIRAVIFDFNGVLVDDEPVHFALFREVLAQEGIALSAGQYHERYLGYDDRRCFEAVLGDAGRAADRCRVDDLVARKAQRYAAVAETGLRSFPGTVETLAALADRWPLAICSGALRPEIEFALNRMGLRDRVAVIVSANDMTRSKPDPEGYTRTLAALRARPGADLEPGQCLVVEDSRAGVASAKAAGMWAVGVATTCTPEELRHAGADAVLPGLADLTPDWILREFPTIAGRDGTPAAG